MEDVRPSVSSTSSNLAPLTNTQYVEVNLVASLQIEMLILVKLAQPQELILSNYLHYYHLNGKDQALSGVDALKYFTYCWNIQLQMYK